MNNKRLSFIYGAGVLFIFLSVILSINYGAKAVGISDLLSEDMPAEASAYIKNVVAARIPRTIFGLIAGASLAVSGVLMQTVTRNPVADPSILGVNTGASLFIVAGITFFNIQTRFSYITLALAGGLVTALFVYKLSSLGAGGTTPIKLVIAGAAVSAALSSVINILVMPNSSVMTTFRFWQVGSIGGVTYSDIYWLLPLVLATVITSLIMTHSLNALLLSEETAVGLGINVSATRIVATCLGVLLCSTTTALAGPISFLGLMVPHMVRIFVKKTDIKHVILLSAIYGSSCLVLSDTLGRFLGRPGELESGIVTALIGGPVFIMSVRKLKVSST